MNPAALLAAEVAEAHGGLDRWRAVGRLTVDFSSGGLAFTTKGQPDALSGVTGWFRPDSQSVRLLGGRPGAWEYRAACGLDLVADLTRLRRLRSKLRWTATELGTFAAAAMWTYLAVPFALGNGDIGLEMLSSRHRLRRLRVRFPGTVATHCREQVLHIDADGLIRRHDYTALAFGRWARAAQVLDAYREFGGLLVATDRRVTPRLLGRKSPGPTLVWIRVDDVRIEQAAEAGPS